MLYLDNAATTYKKPNCMYRDMITNTILLSANAGRGGHKLSIKASEKIVETADDLAQLFNIDDASRIAFMPNATCALNTAISGLGKNTHIIVTSMDHNSVLRPVHANFKYTVVQANEDGLVDPHKIERAIQPNTKLIICTHVSNVCGTIQPINMIGAIAKKYKILFLVDAAQSAGCLNIDVQSDNIDMLAFSGHKGLMGPLGTGGLYVRNGIELTPIIRGGTGSQSESLNQPKTMPDMLQSGTQNTPAIAALGASVQFIKKQGLQDILKHERDLAQKLITELKNIEGIKVYGTNDINKRNGTVCFNLDKVESSEVAEILSNEYNIAVRGGWHCAYLAHKTLGTHLSGAVRASFGFFNTKKDLIKLVDAINKIANK